MKIVNRIKGLAALNVVRDEIRIEQSTHKCIKCHRLFRGASELKKHASTHFAPSQKNSDHVRKHRIYTGRECACVRPLFKNTKGDKCATCVVDSIARAG